eukprot:TRINITY_DN1932_c0_g1_i9.p1 TRINITY_DN1932_c0_g1~~TRINITY_DN1932_c0_g1_i9.p1  ORF type:complete len:1630 (+),score=403.81 TRINITY_DN1932_c0_g1_i9:106-4995(+)
MAVGLVALLALAGEPQCPTPMWDCVHLVSGTAYGNAWNALRTATAPYSTLSAAGRRQLCSKERAMMADQCIERCPLRMAITSPPGLQMEFCVADNRFVPTYPGGHLDENHVMNNVEYDIEVAAFPNASRWGCQASNFDGKNFTGKIALVDRGGCLFPTKFLNAKAAGSVAGVLVNDRPGNDIVSAANLSMAGTAAGLETYPAVSAVPHYLNAVKEALDHGETVRGKFVCSCDGLVVPKPEEAAAWDGCPSVKMNDGAFCAAEPSAEARLCTRCPLSIGFKGAAPVCVWGNNLLPRRAANTFKAPLALNNAVWAELPRGGCTLSDYEGLEGKVVLAYAPARCLEHEAVRYASAMKVAAVVFVNSVPQGLATLIEGPSSLVDIPVHSISNADFSGLLPWIMNSTTPFNATVPSGRPATLRALEVLVLTATPEEDVATVEETAIDVHEADTREVIESVPDFEANAVVITMFALIGVLFMSVCVAYRRGGEEDTGSAEDAKSTVPLGVANLGLSLSLLLITAGVAFFMAYEAGQSATETAMTDGKAAANLTYTNAVNNVQDLATQLRTNIIARVKRGTLIELEKGEMVALAAANANMGMQLGSWASFADHIPAFVNFAKKMFAEGWAVNIFTENGFFVNSFAQTDDRADEVRRDGVVGSVRETNNGALYGFNKMFYDQRVYRNRFWTHESAKAWNMSYQLGGRPGDPLSVTRGKSRDMMLWRVSKLTFPTSDRFQLEHIAMPLSVFTPLWNRQNQFIGTVEARTSYTTLANVLAAAIDGEQLENMTVVLFDQKDLQVITTNAFTRSRYRASVYMTGAEWLQATWSMFDMPPVHLRAYANFIESVSGWEGHSGSFDQQAFWTPQDLTAFRIRAVNGAAADVSGAQYDLEMRNGGCGSCVRQDGSLHFDGENALHIYRNLTTASHWVKDTQLPTPNGEWKSSLSEFSKLKPIYSTGEECVVATSYTNSPAGEDFCLTKEPVTMMPYTLHMSVKPTANIPGEPATAATPVLFGDTAQGEANVRLHATGELYINVVTYGCRIAPYGPGIPAGVWTSVTVVVHYEPAVTTSGYCMVYINGTLHERQGFSAGASTLEWREAYLVGHGFEGSMDNITIHNHTLSATEVASLHADGVYTRDVPAREWYADLETLDENNQLRSGVRWGVVAMIPRRDIMNAVDENNRVASATLAQQEANTKATLRQKSTETILIVVVIALVTALVFLLFNELLTRPFATCALLMQEAAVMRVDEIPETSSRLREINAMNRAMALMLQNLKEFKSYMPLSCVLETDDEDCGPQTDGLSPSSMLSAGSASDGGLSPSRIRFMADTPSNQASHTTRSKLSVGSRGTHTTHAGREDAAVAARQALTMMLTKKRMTYLASNVLGFLDHIQAMSDSTVLGFHASLLSVVLRTFQANKGIAEVFQGDRFACSFNGARNCVNHRVAACNAALQIANQTRGRDADGGVLCKLSMTFAVACGEARVGNCGNEIMKKFTFMSNIVPWVQALERVASRDGGRCVADSFVYEEVTSSFFLRRVFEVLYPKRLVGKPIGVAEIVSGIEMEGGEEWMYELDNNEARDPYSKYNAFARAVYAQNWAEARALQSQANEAARTEMEKRDFAQLSAAVEAETYSPIALAYN